MHCDLVYWSARTYLLCVDEITGYVFKDPVDVKTLLDSGAMLKESTKNDEVAAHGKAVAHEKETTEQVRVEDSKERDIGTVPASLATPRRTIASNDATAEAARPTYVEHEKTSTPIRTGATREPEAAVSTNAAPVELRRSTRERKQSKWLAGTTGENRTAFLTLGESSPEDDLLKGQPLAGPAARSHVQDWMTTPTSSTTYEITFKWCIWYLLLKPRCRLTIARKR
jgi:hypothetical protein